MNRLVPAALACLSLLLVSGCSTHDDKFGDVAPARVPTSNELRAATNKLLVIGEDSISELDPRSAAIFTEAASEFASATGAPAARARAKHFGTVLLLARVPKSDGFYGVNDPSKIDMPTTVRAGAALRAAYGATAIERFRQAAAAVPGQILTPTSGWRSKGGLAYLYNSPTSKRASISESSLTGGELAAAARDLTTGTQRDAAAGLAGTADAQAALGRWYSTLGSTSPMSLEQWATTLLGLEAQQSKKADGILAVGVPAMFNSAFTKGGRLVPSPLTTDDPQGVGVAVSAVSRSAFTNLASAGQRALLEHARDDGTIDLAPADDLAAQAEFARALAIGLRATVKAERAKQAARG